jgi:hypothetical protein
MNNLEKIEKNFFVTVVDFVVAVVAVVDFVGVVDFVVVVAAVVDFVVAIVVTAVVAGRF